jgi:hypothetical protein
MADRIPQSIQGTCGEGQHEGRATGSNAAAAAGLGHAIRTTHEPLATRRQIGLDDKTARRYVGILEQAYLVRRVEPWFRNQLKRLVKTPKLRFLDSGLLAALLGRTLKRLAANRHPFGALLETFAFAELAKQVTWSEAHYALNHYCDKDGEEVDVVIERDDGSVIGLKSKRPRRSMPKTLAVCVGWPLHAARRSDSASFSTTERRLFRLANASRRRQSHACGQNHTRTRSGVTTSTSRPLPTGCRSWCEPSTSPMLREQEVAGSNPVAPTP